MNGEIVKLRKELEKKGKEISALTQKINNLQYVVEDKKNATVRISAQIVANGFIPAQDMASFLKLRPILLGGRATKAQHPDYVTVLYHLTQISKLLTKAKKGHDGFKPKLRRGDRSNMYTLEDYKNFGNTILSDYFKENPYDKWNVSPVWDIPEEDIPSLERR